MDASAIKKLNGLSDSFLRTFFKFLEDDENLKFLSDHIGTSGVIVEIDGYQLSIQTQGELSLIKSELESLVENEFVE